MAPGGSERMVYLRVTQPALKAAIRSVAPTQAFRFMVFNLPWQAPCQGREAGAPTPDFLSGRSGKVLPIAGALGTVKGKGAAGRRPALSGHYCNPPAGV